jgi:hypothetical protein
VKFEFRCKNCGEIHQGMPGFGADAPLSYYAIPESERALRCELGSDDCVIDRSFFFVRGCLEIPVRGTDEPLIWGVWVDLSERSFATWLGVVDQQHRSHVGPFLGWLNAWLKPYPETMNLKTRVHLRDHGLRPWVELEPTDHPLALEQRNGISVDRVAEIYAIMMHGEDPAV